MFMEMEMDMSAWGWFLFVLRSWISPEKRGFWETATTIIFRFFLLLFLDLTLTFLD